MLKKRVIDYITRHALLDRENLHLVALSGGADSVCLLMMLVEMGYSVHAVHCNFRLRGMESDRDEEFCKTLCRQLGIELHLTHFDTMEYAELHKVSIEMAARELRYTYFEQLRKAIEAEDIVVAHHRDDNVETFLMNVMRGTGIHGLAAIKPRNGRIIRPLLCISRQEIEEYLAEREQVYVTDSTNLVDDVTRNKIRLNLLPMMESINPAVRDNILATIENVVESVNVVDDAVGKGIAEVTMESDGATVIDIQKLMDTPSPEMILFSILKPCGFSSAMIRQVHDNLDAPTGKTWESNSHILASDRGTFFLLQKDSHSEREMKIPEDGIYIYNERVKIGVEICKRDEAFVPSKEKYRVTLDANKVAFPLTVRRITVGDKFQPFGMKGTKLVSDYLTDRKRNYMQRREQLVVTDGKGEIVWLVGERASQKAACTDDTIKIMTLRFIRNV